MFDLSFLYPQYFIYNTVSDIFDLHFVIWGVKRSDWKVVLRVIAVGSHRNIKTVNIIPKNHLKKVVCHSLIVDVREFGNLSTHIRTDLSWLTTRNIMIQHPYDFQNMLWNVFCYWYCWCIHLFVHFISL